MKTQQTFNRWVSAGLLLLLGILLFSGYALAQSGYQLVASVITGGGSLANGSYTLTGTTGQAEAGQQFAGGAYSLTGGFWRSGAANSPNQAIYLPLVTR